MTDESTLWMWYCKGLLQGVTWVTSGDAWQGVTAMFAGVHQEMSFFLSSHVVDGWNDMSDCLQLAVQAWMAVSANAVQIRVDEPRYLVIQTVS